MSEGCMSRASLKAAYRTAPVLLSLTVLLLLSSIVASAKSLHELDLARHAEEERAKAGQSGVLPVPSNHTFINLCSNKLVQLLPKKRVDAKGRSPGRYSELLITSASFAGLVRIQNARSKQYLCFNSKGKLKVKHSGDEKCIFEELHEPSSPENTYMYRSYKYKDFYLGFNKNGKKLRGPLPRRKRKRLCYKFLKSSGIRSFKKKGTGAGGPYYGVSADFSRIGYGRPARHSRQRAGRRKAEKT